MTRKHFAPYRNEDRTLPDGTIVQRFRVCASNTVIHCAWTPLTTRPDGRTSHTTQTTFGDTWYGQVGTETLPAELDALPAYSDERAEAVKAWHAQRDAAAIEIIRRAFPELADRPHAKPAGNEIVDLEANVDAWGQVIPQRERKGRDVYQPSTYYALTVALRK